MLAVARREVIDVPAESLIRNERPTSQLTSASTSRDDELREWARFDRPTTEAKVDREVRRLTSRG